MNTIQEALNFYGLKSPIKDKKIIKNRFQKLSMKYHPDKGGSENDFKLLSKYREILEKNFNFISQKDSKYKGFGDSKKYDTFNSYKKSILLLKGKEQAEKLFDIFLRIYFEGLCFKAILFFLFLIYISPNIEGGLMFLLIGIVAILIISIGKDQNGINALKSSSIFTGIGTFIFAGNNLENYTKGILGNPGIIMFYSLLVIPIVLFILNKYGKDIKKIIGKVLPVIFIIFLIGGIVIGLAEQIGLLN